MRGSCCVTGGGVNSQGAGTHVVPRDDWLQAGFVLELL